MSPSGRREGDQADNRSMLARIHEIGWTAMAKMMPLLLAWVAWLAFSYGGTTNASASQERRITTLEQEHKLIKDTLSKVETSTEVIKSDLNWIKSEMKGQRP